MELIHESTTQTVQRTVNVVDGPIVETRILGKPREVRVAQVRISYHLVSGAWQAHDVHVSGPVRYQGRDTKGKHDLALRTEWQHGREWEFVRNIVDSLRPVGAAHLPFSSPKEN